jgi:hypothetical protein
MLYYYAHHEKKVIKVLFIDSGRLVAAGFRNQIVYVPLDMSFIDLPL